MGKDTSRIMEEINKMKDKSELEDYIKANSDAMNYPNAIDYLLECAAAHGIQKSVLTTSNAIEQSFANRILNCTRPFNRNHLLTFAFLGGLTLEETQNVLKYGGVSQLYPKNVRDSVIIFALSNHKKLQDVDEALGDMNLELVGRYKK